jgi:ComF family protein
VTRASGPCEVHQDLETQRFSNFESVRTGRRRVSQGRFPHLSKWIAESHAMLRELASTIFDFALPRECPACRVVHEESAEFCLTCEDELQRLIAAPRCGRCAMPLTMPNSPCPHCTGDGLSPFHRVVALGVLDGPLRKIIHRAKYEHRWPLAEMLGDELRRQHDCRALLAAADLIVPVPLHINRQRERGYNQAEAIARRFGRRRVRQVAIRHRKTETQTHIHSRAQRTENLRGAFGLIDPDAIVGKNVLLVDDVMTTGATLVSLGRVIKAAKPAGMSAIVVAVADPKGRAFEVI